MLGLNAGVRHIDKYVVGPEQCKALKNRAGRQAIGKQQEEGTFAECLEVEVDGIDPVRGRKVFATPSAIVLFDPDSGRAERMPVKGARITLLGKL